MTQFKQTTPNPLREVAAVFLKLGFIAFGGPAAHIAMFRDETVKRRQWITEQHFLDLLGATNLIPGPNSTEMAIHLSFVRAGWAGLIVGGACFIGPAMVTVLALAWAYVRFGSTPEAGWLLYGVKPVVIAIIAQALWGLGQKAVKGPLTAGVGLAVLVLYFLGANELGLLFAGGLVVMAGENLGRFRKTDLAGLLPPPRWTVTLRPGYRTFQFASHGPDLSENRGSAVRQRLRAVGLSAG